MMGKILIIILLSASSDLEVTVVVAVIDILILGSLFLIDVIKDKKIVYQVNLNIKQSLNLAQEIQKNDMWYLFVFVNFLFILYTVLP